MNSKIILLSIILFSMTAVVKAQPSSPPIFNPFDICRYSTDPVDNIFYGEIKSIEEFDGNIGVDINDYYNSARFKAVVKVIKSFKGDLSQEVNVYFRQAFQLNRPLAANGYIFRTKNALKDGVQIQYVKQLSKPITNYSKKGLNEVFGNIQSFVNKERKDFVEGVLLERILGSRKVDIKGEKADRLIYDVESKIPIKNALIEFVNKENGVVYRVKTKDDGTFRINKILDGTYDVKTQIEGMKLETYLMYFDHTVCSSKWFISMIRNQ